MPVRPVISMITASLLLLLLLTFWLRSHTIGDAVTYRSSPYQVNLESTDGIVAIGGGRIESNYQAPEGWEGSFWPFHRQVDYISADNARGTYLGFLFERHDKRSATTTYNVVGVRAPYWFLALWPAAILLLLTRAQLRDRQYRTRLAKGCRVVCGYDLRATPDRCPECGHSCVRGEWR